ncbi:ABC transporter substrate-binding protein [Serpentinicella alkaliphila]|uniref:ABC-type uncharacterized transport system substrate-binding protein n=1 Tax=Serpentinicella alkaliphila TaxID=1734049 RepID=A0A4R2T7A1_9FIRM|nr:ABC transporter substrate binding protein [Serpentinicella alkaliphila]QUH25732.1 hypothetical protein HZR23_08280 [Serpentinicella alkaliphila]TCP99019.1 ABC-type uncharacterized transport system substrate-binding protein [Serpentinicella alkaliphila]
MKRFIRILSLIFFLLFLSKSFSVVIANTSKPTHTTKNILFLNSYHSGYKWSDDIYDGIRSVLNSGPDKIKLQVEYMDTQRGVDEQYLKLLLDTYKYKFRDKYFDLIISSDDAAFEFLIKHSNELFPETPVVFCGVNYFEQSTIDNHKQFTGVIEGFDISSTIDTAIKFHPYIQNVYYIVDDTTTGNSIMKEFSKSISGYSSNLDFVQLYGENLDEIINKVSFLSKNSIILYLIHFRDNQNNYYEYYEAISMIEQNSSVPIYGVWNFNLGHGIVGGKLTNGFYQGKTAAKIALRILAGEQPNNIPVLTEETTHYEFDFNQLVKHNIPLELLPQDSKIINKSSPFKKQILILHSYNKGLKWTDDLELGIKSKLAESNLNLEFTYEYMDSQRNSDPVYLHHLYELLIRKYKDKQFDLVITTDDVAFNFIKTHHNNVFKGIPSIFCGVNYFEECMLEEHDFLTGVVESYDLRGTLDMALEINPKIKNIIVINDTTITGQSNQKNLDIIIPEYSDRVSFKIWNNLTMAEIQEGVKSLNTEDIILLLSLNRDKSNNSFSYDESISLISENASVPIYGVWDFYLGKGLLGGVLTSGITHGETVGHMAIEILNGKYPSEIVVVTESPNIYMFDYFMLKKFSINIDKLPIGSTIINKPSTIFDYYQDNKKVLLSTASIFFSVMYNSFINIFEGFS